MSKASDLRKKLKENNIRVITPQRTAQREDRPIGSLDRERVRDKFINDFNIKTQKSAIPRTGFDNTTVEHLQKQLDAPVQSFNDLDLRDKNQINKFLEYDDNASQFVVDYNSGKIFHSEDNVAKYNNYLDTIKMHINARNDMNSRYNKRNEVAYTDDKGKSYSYDELMRNKVAENRVSDLNLGKDGAKDVLSQITNGGNYDVFSSTAMSGKELQNRGWNVSENDRLNFTQPYFNELNNTAAVFSPIVKDEEGNVQRILSPEELEEYAQGVLSGNGDKLNLMVTDKYTGSFANSLAQENSKRISRLSERYYNDTDFEGLLNEASVEEGDYKNARDRLNEYGVDWEEYQNYNELLEDKEKTEQFSNKYAEWSAQNFGTGALATAANILTSPLQAFEYIANLGDVLTGHLKAGTNELSSELIPNTYDDKITTASVKSNEAITSAIRSSIQGDGDNAFLNAMGELAAQTYGGITSSVQSALVAVTSSALLPPGIAEAVSLGVLGGQSANSSYHDVINNGGSVGQATMYSVASGFNELLGESMSIESLLNIRDVVGKSTAKELLTNILKQSVTEGTEEGITESLNEFADRIINGDKSEYQRNIQAYLDSGLTEKEAENRATLDFLSRVAWSVYGGAIGGASSGGGKMVLNTGRNAINEMQKRNTGQDIVQNNNEADLVEMAMSLPDDSKHSAVRLLAQELLNNKTENGSEIGSKERKSKVGELYNSLSQNATERARDSFAPITRESVKEQVAKLGVNKNVDAVTEAIYKYQNNETLSEYEHHLLNTQVGQQIVSALNEKQQQRADDIGTLGKLASLKQKKKDSIDVSDLSISDDGKAFDSFTDTPIEIQRFEKINKNGAVLKTGESSNVNSKDVVYKDSAQAIVYETIASLKVDGRPIDAETANVILGEVTATNEIEARYQINALKDAFTRGTLNRSIDTMVDKNGRAMGDLPFDSLLKVKNAGVNLSNKYAQANQNVRDKALEVARKGSKIKPESKKVPKDKVTYRNGKENVMAKANARQKASVDVLERVAEALNVEIEVFVSDTNRFGKHIGKNGSYNQRTGKIEIDLYAGKDGKGTILFTLAHELTHNIRVSSPEIYKKLSDFLVKEYEKQGKSVENVIAYYKNKYKYSYDVAHEEWVADSMESMFVKAFEGDTKQLNRLQQKCHDVWLKIRELFTKLARVICNEYKGLNPDSEAGRFVVKLSDDTFNVLKEMYFEGLGEIAKQREHFSGLDELVSFIDEHGISKEGTDLENYKTKNTANNDGVRYSLNRNAKTELHKALYDKNYSEDVLLRDVTPSIMLAQKGVKNLPMVMNISHIRENVFTEAEARQLGLRVDKHTHYHGLGEAFYLKVIDGLDNITEAYRGTKSADNSARRENYFLLVSQFKDDNGNVVNVPVYINETTQHNRVFIDTNKISTVFGRDNFRKYISNEISRGNLVRIKNKSTTSSEPNALIAERYRSNASNSIISQSNTTVNNNSMQEDERNSLRDDEYLEAVNNGDMETAQRMVDEAAVSWGARTSNDGKPISLYHGTPKGFGFTVFDADKVDDKLSFFVTDNKNVAMTYSGDTKRSLISDRETINIDNASRDELLEMLRRNLDVEYQMLNKKQIHEEVIMPVVKEIYISANKVREFIQDNIYAFNEKKKSLAYKLARSIEDIGGVSESGKEIDGLITEYYNRRREFRDYDYIVFDELEEFAELDKLGGRFGYIDKYLGTEIAFSNGIKVLNENEAWETLSNTAYRGIYRLYGKTDGMLEIDANGSLWNNIKGWQKGLLLNDKNTSVKKGKNSWVLIDNKTGNEISDSEIVFNNYTENWDISQVHSLLLNKANNIFAIKTENVKTTRDIARFAKKNGYKGVVISNLIDLGGAYRYSGSGTIYIFFDSANLKSADPVTYDDNGDVIPLSKRFDDKNEDIRLSQRDFKNALSSAEWKKYNYAMISKVDAGLRISDHSILVECEDSEYSYKLVVYDNETEENDIIAIYGIGENLYNDDISNFDQKIIGEFITELEDRKYDNKQMLERLLKSYSKNVGYVLGRYNTRSHRFNKYGQKVSEGSKVIRQQDDRNRVYHSNQGDEVILYQARPDFEDIIFDDFDGEVTDNDARLMAEYFKNGNTDIMYHLINRTRNIDIADGVVKNLVSRLTKSYELSTENNKEISVAILSLLESKDKSEVEDNLKMLGDVFKKSIDLTSFVSDDFKILKKDITEFLRDYNKEHSVYLTDEQISSLEFQGLSVNWLKKKLFGTVNIVKEDSDSKKSKVSFGYFYHTLAEHFPEVFNIDDVDSVDNWELFLDKIEYIKNPPEMSVEQALGMTENEFSSELSARMLADVVESKYNSRKNSYVETLVNKLRKDHNKMVQKARIEARNKVKERYEKKLDAIAEKNKEQRRNAVERRGKTAVKQKIRKTVSQIDSYLNKGNKKKNVKEGMRDFVSKALETAEIIFKDDITNEDIINRGVVGLSKKEQDYFDRYKELIQQRGIFEERYEKERSKNASINALQDIRGMISRIDGKISYLDKQLSDMFAREKAKLYETPVREAINALANTYSDLRNSEHTYIANAFDENVMEMLTDLNSDNVIGGGTRVRDMSISQLEKVHDAFTAVLTTIRNANKLFLSNNTVASTSEISMEEMASVKKSKQYESDIQKFIEKFGFESLKPIYAFRTFGSKTFESLFWNLQKGESKWYQNIAKVRNFYKTISEKYNYNSWDFKTRTTFTDIHGNTFDLTLEEMMSIYALSRRDQGREHLIRDGFVFDKNIKVSKDGKEVYHTGSTAHSLDIKILSSIANKLTDEQRNYVKEMQKYLSSDMAELGNEVSMKLFGIKQYKETAYFPIKVSRDFLPTDYSRPEAEVLLKNSGFSHNIVKKAGQPLVLSEFSTVWATHCNEMSKYNAFVLPLEDIMKVLNYRTSSVSTGGPATSVKQEIGSRFGDGAKQYIETFIKDINGGVRSDSLVGVDKLISLSKKASVFASLSVTIQQPFAVGRAMAIVNPKYFAKSSMKSFNLAKHNKDWAELIKYSPVAGIKEMGYFDVGIGQKTVDWILQEEYHGAKEKTKAFVFDSDYRDEVFSVAPAKADELAWVTLWHAVKSEIKDTTNLTGEAYLERCGERFNEVVQLTQVYDSVFSRSGHMRKKDPYSKMATAFMAEPTVNLNMMLDSLVQGKRIGGKQGAKYTFKIASTVFATQIVTALAKSLWTSGRDDDEEKKWIEKYLGTAKEEILSDINPLSWIVFTRDIISIIQGYSVERMDMDVFTEMITSSTKLVNAIVDPDKSPTEKEISNFIGSFSSVFGLPIKNIYRDIKTALNLLGAVGSSDSEDMYNTYLKNGESALKNTVDSMIQEKYDYYFAQGETEEDAQKKARTSVKSAVTRDYKELYLTAYYVDKDTETATNIYRMLYYTGLYGRQSELDKTISNWRKDYYEKLEKEKRAKDRKSK